MLNDYHRAELDPIPLRPRRPPSSPKRAAIFVNGRVLSP